MAACGEKRKRAAERTCRLLPITAALDSPLQKRGSYLAASGVPLPRAASPALSRRACRRPELLVERAGYEFAGNGLASEGGPSHRAHLPRIASWQR